MGQQQKTDLKEIGCECADWINLGQEVQKQTLGMC